MKQEMDSFLTAAELAKRLGVSLNHIRQLTAKREIPHHKLSRNIVRYNAIEIMAWINKKRVPEHLQ